MRRCFMSYIGVFDSGLGGMSILKALQRQFPYESFVYLADTKNIPYGDKSATELQKIFHKNINFFDGYRAIVVACNTMSSFVDNQAISIIDSLVNTTDNEYSNIKSIGILGTKYIVDTEIYPKRLQKYDVHQVPAPLLVPAIESGDASVDELCKYYLEQFPKDMTHLILGCTHYNLLFDKIQELNKNLIIINPYSGIIDALTPHTKKSDTIKPIKFLTTKYTEDLQINSEKIMQQKINWQEVIV